MSDYGETLDQQEELSMKMLYYTREDQGEDIYAPRLADSLHLAFIHDDGTCTPLSHNQGLAFAKAGREEDGILHPYSLTAPKIVAVEGGYSILAKRIETDRTEDVVSRGQLLHLTTRDFIYYHEEPLLSCDSEEAQAWSEEPFTELAAIGLSEETLPEGAIPYGVVEITQEQGIVLANRFLTPINVANEVPSLVKASSAEELSEVRVVARYSDGSTVTKRVDWDMRNVRWDVPGRYPVDGRVHQDRYEFPVAWHKADPAICKWNGKFYFISTNDLDGNRSLYIREADSIPALVTAQQTLILDTTMYPHLRHLLWAPELHIIEGKLYCFHAGTPDDFPNEQCHVMALKEGGSPLKAEDWEMSRRVIKADGSMLFTLGITLDMTVMRAGGRLCAVWSQRRYNPKDFGAWLMIAEIDPQKPWQLRTEPQVLCVPEYGWENNHTYVDEGPFALYHDGKVMLTFSGAFIDSSYVVSMMTIDENADPLVFSNWTKENAPLLTSRSVPGEYGTGHNAYVTDDDGLVFNTYHALPGLGGPRSSGIRRVHFGIDGHPWLDMTEEMDLVPSLSWVKTVVEV